MKHLFYGISNIEEDNKKAFSYFGNQRDKIDEEYLQRAYDLADIIVDKRMDKTDEDLKAFFENIENQTEKNDILCSENIENDHESYRIRCLKKLLETIKEKEYDDKYEILCLLTKGNICLRLSRVYHETFDLKNASKYAEQASEYFRTGYIISCSDKFASDETVKMYHRLLRLNLAKINKDFARRNHKSEFMGVGEEFKHVSERAIAEYTEITEPNLKRQYALIVVDAVLNMINVIRRGEDKELGEGVIDDLLKQINVKEKGLKVIEAIKDWCDIIFNNNDSVTNSLKEAGLEKRLKLNGYDIKRNSVLMMVEKSRIYRDKHSRMCYMNAMASAIEAEKILSGDGSRYNADALIVLSSSLRNFIKYSDEEILQYKDCSLKISTKFDQNTSFQKMLEKVLGDLEEYSKGGYLKARSEIFKWYYLCLRKWKINEDIKNVRTKIRICYSSAKENIEKDNNIIVDFLYAKIMLETGKIAEAKEILEKLCKEDYCQYIRRKSVGLKIHYLLSNCYMSDGEYEKAKKMLEILRCKDEKDERVKIDLGYCYLKTGSYEEALNIYETLFPTKKGEISAPLISRTRLIMGLNNYYAVCVLGTNNYVLKDASRKKKLEERARLIYKKLCELSGKEDSTSDCETNFIRGIELVSKDKEFSKEAETYFYNAMLNYARNKLIPDEIRHTRPYLYNKAQYESAYIVHLLKEYDYQQINGKIAEMEITVDKIQRFFFSYAEGCAISLSAAILLAKWLIKLESTICNQIWQIFGRINIYEEDGARLFGVLKKNNHFRNLDSEVRGKIIANLLCMCEPINAIKERCRLDLADDSSKLNLSHYTKIDTLKNILRNDSGSEKRPNFRLSNTAYMNDLFEGNIFLEMLCKADENTKGIVNSTFETNKNFVRNKSDVYLGSLSRAQDSFTMWSIYGDKEKGCTIQFGDAFFNICGSQYNSLIKDYLMSKYLDSDYPLYNVQYISYDENGEVYINEFKDDLYNLAEAWKRLKDLLEKEKKKEDVEEVHRFAVNMINEVRYLFKSDNYKSEEEVRIIDTQFFDDTKANTEWSTKVPKVYVEINREIEDLTVKLGSKIDNVTLSEIIGWLSHSPYVKNINLSQVNRKC